MKKPQWALIVDTFEPDGEMGSAVPVVTHIFRGPTQEYCEGTYQAHLKSDRFLNQCTLKGEFGSGSNAFRCNSVITWRKLKI